MRKYLLLIFVLIVIAVIAIVLLLPKGKETQTTEQIFEERYVEWQKFLDEKLPLEIKVKSSFHESLLYANEPFRKIIEIGVPVLPYIIVKIREDRTLCHALFKITRWRYHIERQGLDPSEYVWIVEEFPELQQRNGPPNRVELWLYWWREGRKKTPHQFDSLYNEWKQLKESGDSEKAGEAYMNIYRLGIIALPFIIEKIESGDTALIPLIAMLTTGEIKRDATIKECVEWWQNNKEKWYIPIVDESKDR